MLEAARPVTPNFPPFDPAPTGICFGSILSPSGKDRGFRRRKRLISSSTPLPSACSISIGYCFAPCAPASSKALQISQAWVKITTVPCAAATTNRRWDEFIAVTFTVSRSVRPISFHSKSDLSAVDYCFECRMTTDGLRPEGSSLAETLKALCQGAHYLPPNAVTIYNATAEEGSYFGFDVDFARLF